MRSVDLVIIYRIIKILVTKWTDQPAYKLGIIDAEGHVLRKANTLRTAAEKNAYSFLFRFCFNLKRLLVLVPGGKTRLGTFTAAALLLLKEEDEAYLDSNIQFEMRCIAEEENLGEDGGVGGVGGGGMSMGGGSMSVGAFAPTNYTGGSIAMIDSPLFKKKKKKLKKFSEQF